MKTNTTQCQSPELLRIRTHDVSGVAVQGHEPMNYQFGATIVGPVDVVVLPKGGIPASQLTDDQLLNECERRKMYVEALRDASDAALRTECERRGLYLEQAPMSKMREERDEYRRAMEREANGRAGAAHGWATASARCVELERERDEWKRRAEAALAKLAGLKMKPPEFMALLEKAAHRMNEPGPGIAALDLGPDNSIAHLPEDLLADDA